MALPTDDRGRFDMRDDRPGEGGGIIKGLLALIGLAAVVVVVLVVLVAGKTSDSAKEDVSVRVCSFRNAAKPRASGVVRNHTSKTSNYVIHLRFLDGEHNPVAEGIAAVKNVAADNTAQWKLTGDREVNGKVTCELTAVSRTNLPGQ